MPYYHATRIEKLASIRQHGLGGIDTQPTSIDCEPGVYLASGPEVPILIMIDHYLSAGDEGSNPSEEFKQWIVLVIDDHRIDPSRLRPDPQLNGANGTWIYDGVIDVNNCVALTSEQIFQENARRLEQETD